MITVTFVCLGNICRSPMAEAIFEKLVNEAKLTDQFTIDSAGTSSYHVGDMAHPGTRQVLKKHGIQYTGQSRQISSHELSEIDYIIAMDRENLRDLQQMAREADLAQRMSLLLSYGNTNVIDVPDPYYTGNFERVYELVHDGCEGLLTHIQAEQEL